MATLYIGMLFVCIPAAITFVVLFALSKRIICLNASLLWLVPPVWEYYVQATCGNVCIRVDIVLVFPIALLGLILISISAYLAYADAHRSKHRLL